ncbi:MAG: molecular chaperone HscA [Cognaticolwellia sp.]
MIDNGQPWLVHRLITVKPSFGLEADEITNMLKDPIENAEQDMQVRMLKEQQFEASQVIESIQAALFSDSALLNTVEISKIDRAISVLKQISQTGNADEVEAAIAILNNSTTTFAKRRMDSSIRAALSGHSVDKV